MKFNAVIFDLDGTLVNSLDDIAEAMNRVLEKRNLPVQDTQSYKTFIGNGLRNLITVTLPQHERNEATIDACLSEMMGWYEEHCLHKTCLYDGIAALMDQLTKLNIKMAIFSNKADALTKKIAASLLGSWHFEAVIGMTTEERKKPSPIVPIEISHRFGVPPGQIIYVGDSGVDMRTAVNAGMFAAGVVWGFRSANELQQNGAQALIEEPKGLLNLL